VRGQKTEEFRRCEVKAISRWGKGAIRTQSKGGIGEGELHKETAKGRGFSGVIHWLGGGRGRKNLRGRSRLS